MHITHLAIPLAMTIICGVAQTPSPGRPDVLSTRLDRPMATRPVRLPLQEALKTAALLMTTNFVSYGIELTYEDFPMGPSVTRMPRLGET